MFARRNAAVMLHEPARYSPGPEPSGRVQCHSRLAGSGFRRQARTSIGRPRRRLDCEIGAHTDGFPARRWNNEPRPRMVAARPEPDPLPSGENLATPQWAIRRSGPPATADAYTLPPFRSDGNGNLRGIWRKSGRRPRPVARKARCFTGVERTDPDIDIAGFVASVRQHSPVAETQGSKPRLSL